MSAALTLAQFAFGATLVLVFGFGLYEAARSALVRKRDATLMRYHRQRPLRQDLRNMAVNTMRLGLPTFAIVYVVGAAVLWYLIVL